MKIRNSTLTDLPQIQQLYADARRFMMQNANPDQWGTTYPPEDLILQDIADGKSYVCLDGDCIVGTFYFACEEDPTYETITKGEWMNAAPYGVVHRITSAVGTHGVATFCLNWCFSQCKNLRIDTHRLNLPMRKTLGKNGFSLCGIIYLKNGDERLAFQKIEA